MRYKFYAHTQNIKEELGANLTSGEKGDFDEHSLEGSASN
jgi:hypothetical protein